MEVRCRATGIPRGRRGWRTARQICRPAWPARLGGEPLISNGPENKFEFRYNTSHIEIYSKYLPFVFKTKIKATIDKDIVKTRFFPEKILLAKINDGTPIAM